MEGAVNKNLNTFFESVSFSLCADDDEGVVCDLLELRCEVVPRHEALDVLGGVLHVELGRLEAIV